ncbi:hypothetical protein PENSPDRAFT_736626 [Peniophora sp. CONT]|nr:hypothetical protein PENSPDRAFT_736626 [Peniophora sp. CONT]
MNFGRIGRMRAAGPNKRRVNSRRCGLLRRDHHRRLQNSSFLLSCNWVKRKWVKWVTQLYALDTRPTSFITRREKGLVVRKLGSGWLDVTQSWVQKFLVRSGATTLKVILSSDYKSSKIPTWARDLIHNHIYRVGELAVRGDESLFGVLDNTVNAAPRLTSIFFVFADRYPLTLPAGVQCLLNAPRLRKITLLYVSCDLSQHSWPNLRNLNVRHAGIEAMQILKALSTAPFLESITLIGIIPSYAQSQQIELRNVYQLDVQGKALGVLELWRNLVLPPSARLSFTMDGYSDHRLTIYNAMSILQLIQMHLLSVEDSGRPLMKYKFGVTNTVSIAAFPGYDQDDPFPSSSLASIFRLSMPHSLLPREIEMAELIRALPLASCEVLEIDAIYTEGSRYLWSVQAWSAFIAETSYVKTLRVSGYGANTLVKAAVAGLGREERSVIFPSLQRLYLYQTPFRGSRYDLSKDDTPSFCTDLLSWLSLRKSYATTPIRELIVRKCDLYAEWLAPFYRVEGLVVDWDSDLGELWAASHGLNMSWVGPSTVPDDT